jgi:YVTN family beta-propeller protein
MPLQSYVFVIDVANMQVAGQIPIDKAAGGIVLNSDASIAYVALFGSFAGFGNEVVAIDTAAQAVIATYTGVCGTGNDKGPSALTITPDDTNVFASCLGDVSGISSPPGRIVARINTNDGSITRTALSPNPGVGPFGSDISPDGSKLYVSEFGSAFNPRNTVAVLRNLAGDQPTVSQRITVGQGAQGPALVKFCSDGTFAYVGNNNAATVTRINAQTDTVAQTITFPFANAGPAGITMNSDCSRAYVVHFGSFLFQNNKLSVIDTASGTVIRTVNVPPTGTGPFGVAITPDDAYLVVSDLGSPLSPNDPRVFPIDISDPDDPQVLDPIMTGVGGTGIVCTF